jgi:hypothetical protein
MSSCGLSLSILSVGASSNQADANARAHRRPYPALSQATAIYVRIQPPRWARSGARDLPWGSTIELSKPIGSVQIPIAHRSR